MDVAKDKISPKTIKIMTYAYLGYIYIVLVFKALFHLYLKIKKKKI